jgi:glycerophosphoryl diester phosphodiesterase
MRPLVIAHRGDSAHRPENTLASFTSALELGAELVEFDVQLTKDDEPVVIHDPRLDRTTSGHGLVREHTLAEVRALSAGYPEKFGSRYHGERVPTLQETLHLLKGRARALVEIKWEAVSEVEGFGVEARVVEEIRKAGTERDVAFLSFSTRALRRCRELAPAVTRGHIFSGTTVPDVLRGAREAEADLILPEKSMLSEELLREARAARLRLATWVIDDPAELEGLARYELYGFGTNRPGVLLQALEESLSPIFEGGRSRSETPE